MKLSAYPRPAFDTGLGVHSSPNAYKPLGDHGDGTYQEGWFIQLLRDMGLTWCKLVVNEAEAAVVVPRLFAAGIMPIIRLFREKPNPGTLTPQQKAAAQTYRNLGVSYFETTNEPNLDVEWQDGQWQLGNRPQRVIDAWIADADFIKSIGGLPAIPACAPGGNDDDIACFRAMLQRIKDRGRTDLLDVAWIAVHNSTTDGHPLDYPRDDVNQNGTPVSDQEWGSEAWYADRATVNQRRAQGKNPGQTLLDPGASNCWLKYQALHDIFVQMLGFEIPVLSTEGGSWVDISPKPGVPDRGRYDIRYPKISIWRQNYFLSEIAKSMKSAPRWYFCTAWWCLANQLGGADVNNGFEMDALISSWWANNQVPIVETMKQLKAAGAFPNRGPIPEAPGAEYPSATWIASPNFDAGPFPKRYVIILTLGSSLASGIATFQNPQAQQSAHFLVGKNGEVVQMVKLADKSWCSGDGLLEGQNANNFAYNIELEGAVGQPYPDAQYNALIALLKFLIAREHIPVNRSHLLGHSELTPGPNWANPKDPGPTFDWNRVIQGVGVVQPQPDPSGFHCLLLGQSVQSIVPWSWIEALQLYLKTYRSTLTFSHDDAQRYPNVSIVGAVDAPVPVSAEVEAIVRQNPNVKWVERINVKDAASLQATLDARAGNGDKYGLNTPPIVRVARVETLLRSIRRALIR